MMNKAMIKKAIKRTFGKIYDIANITVFFQEDSINTGYEDIIVIIVEKDTYVRKLRFSSYWETCFTQKYFSNRVLEDEYEWMYERFTRNIEILMDRVA